MTLPTEPIGSIPRPPFLVEGLRAFGAGEIDQGRLRQLRELALADTMDRFMATGSPVVSDGEQAKPSFATYPLDGVSSLAPDGVVIPFVDGHTRQLPRLTAGPFRYAVHADEYLRLAHEYTKLPVKQAVIAPSALSLIYPADGIDGYGREEFLADLMDESEADIRRCLAAGAHRVQLDFTEARLSLKLDPSGGLLRSFIELNNAVLERFSAEERQRIGVHSCPGSDQDAAHSLDVDYLTLLPALFELNVGNFYLQLASEPDRGAVLEAIGKQVRDGQRIFVGVTDPIDPRVESEREVCERVLEAAEHLSPDRLGTCDDCGFAPFADDTSTSRDIAFAKIAARVAGTQLAAERLGV
ncbi:5-methyltetrahydropteroyltriglutamate--homocysteine methyltransferase [Amycolatopsis rhizosphaerae]|uniref:5-methyltetrahydropteroyltriglutamate--homocysteine methyltransferase n=1 Tax=Amycolatopsis rhizosphaerae TaxID=2053003 RepID=A0A558DHJ3_9PSEU|nr:5-methyltetrahydropteroyltriglutamate--homocysteine methyltransferase [Amycolatopsis rhizosphaerae]TVT60501.1 5-methyltetrahydropteroyltriglutamate--homocysteine methyltransferase [Amycolatopsis rhizosphaerae]